MTWTTTDNLDAYLATAGGFLRERPDRHTILLSVTASLKTWGGAWYGVESATYGWWCDRDGRISGAFVWAPPRPVLVSPMPDEAVDQLADVLVLGPRPLSGVNGKRAVADRFAAVWSRRTGVRPYLRAHQRLHRLGELTPPDPAPPGRPRPARPEDRELLLAWCAAFLKDIGEDPSDNARAVDDRLAYGGWTLWEVDCEPVSMAGVTRMISETVRVAPVYTPKELRQRGYAGAATAAVSRSALDAGAREVLLFTDVDNPTSNALYQRLGYRPVEDQLVYGFE